MVARELDYILIASVCLVQGLTMMWLDKVVLLPRSEQSWDEALFNMCNRG